MRSERHSLLRFPWTALKRAAGVAAIFCAAWAPVARAEYAVLQSGQRVHITGYESAGETIRLTLQGGTLEIPADSLLRIDPEDTFPAVKVKLLDVPFADLIAASSFTHGVAAELVASVISVESNFNPHAVSAKSARGLMQLMPGTAARFGVTNVFDPQQNIDAGTRYLKELLVRYQGNLTLALAAYNAGPDRVRQFRSVPPYRETLDYVRRVTEKFNTTYKSSGPLPLLP
jgi:soluble lytic murein transglycosylase-like protein